MSWETAATQAFSGISSLTQMQSGSANANAAIKEGEYKAQNIADNTVRKMGTISTSFAQSGIAIDDSVKQILSQAAGQGSTDIGRTIDNANATSANSYNSARAKALSGLGGNLIKSLGTSNVNRGDVFGSLGSFLPDSAAYGANDLGFGNEAYDMLDPTP